jgi:hypothetical protein
VIVKLRELQPFTVLQVCNRQNEDMVTLYSNSTGDCHKFELLQILIVHCVDCVAYRLLFAREILDRLAFHSNCTYLLRNRHSCQIFVVLFIYGKVSAALRQRYIVWIRVLNIAPPTEVAIFGTAFTMDMTAQFVR